MRLRYWEDDANGNPSSRGATVIRARGRGILVERRGVRFRINRGDVHKIETEQQL